jgi:hypothetical protein
MCDLAAWIEYTQRRLRFVLTQAVMSGNLEDLASDGDGWSYVSHYLMCDYLATGRHAAKKKRKRGRPATTARDETIAGVIADLVEQGWQPTRAHTKERGGAETLSACSVVRTALAQLGHEMAERSIERIWSSLGKRVLSQRQEWARQRKERRAILRNS